MAKTQTRKQLLKTAASIAKAETSVRERWQKLGLAALAHLKEHGDTSLMGAIYDIMGPQSRYRPDFSKWLRKHGLLTIRDGDPEKDETSVVYLMKEKKKPTMINLSEAEADLFWVDSNKNKDPELINGWAMLNGALKRFEEKSAEYADNEKVRVIGPSEAQIKALREMVEKNNQKAA